MSNVRLYPEYAKRMRQIGLDSPEAVWNLTGTICNGHPDRNVTRLNLELIGSVYLKREHRVRICDRLKNLATGFGFVSQSQREAMTLSRLHEVGVASPEVIAFGESNAGAFLLLKEIEDVVDLSCTLSSADIARRQIVCQRVGQALAKMHHAGFTHPDLCCKHIMVGRSHPPVVHLIDWQRSQQRSRLSLGTRARDLAFFNATLPNELLNEQERRDLLSSYCEAFNESRPAVLTATIKKIVRRFSAKRRVRELRDHPVMTQNQSLTQVAGRDMWTTESFDTDWDMQPAAFDGELSFATNCVHPRMVARREDRVMMVQRFRDHRPWRWLWSCLRRRTVLSTAMRQAAMLFRLERFGVLAPKLLIVGERALRPWRIDSFIAVELPANANPLNNAEHAARRSECQTMTAALQQAGFSASENAFLTTGDGELMVCDAGKLKRVRAKRNANEHHTEQNRELERVTIGNSYA